MHSHTPLFSQTIAISVLLLSTFPHTAVIPYDCIFSAFSRPQHSHAPHFSYKIAFSLSRSVLTRRCTRIRSHFLCFFTPLAFRRAALLTYGRIFSDFSLSQHSHAAVLAHDRIFAHPRLSCTPVTYNHLFAAFLLSEHSHKPLFSQSIAFSLSRFLARRSHDHLFAALILSEHSHQPLFSQTIEFSVLLLSDRIFTLWQCSHRPLFSNPIASSLLHPLSIQARGSSRIRTYIL